MSITSERPIVTLPRRLIHTMLTPFGLISIADITPVDKAWKWKGGAVT
jgi:hypothetical protein